MFRGLDGKGLLYGTGITGTSAYSKSLKFSF